MITRIFAKESFKDVGDTIVVDGVNYEITNIESEEGGFYYEISEIVKPEPTDEELRNL